VASAQTDETPEPYGNLMLKDNIHGLTRQ